MLFATAHAETARRVAAWHKTIEQQPGQARELAARAARDIDLWRMILAHCDPHPARTDLPAIEVRSPISDALSAVDADPRGPQAWRENWHAAVNNCAATCARALERADTHPDFRPTARALVLLHRFVRAGLADTIATEKAA